MSSARGNILYCATERRRCEDVYIMGRGVFVCVFACQGAGNAAATSPARGGGRLAASSPRSAIARLPSGASPSPCIPPPQAGSAKGGGIPRPAHSVSAEPRRGCRGGAPPAPADSGGAPRPHAARSAVARLGRNTSLRRIGGISLASVRVSRRHRLRLVPPPLQPLRATMAQEEKDRKACRICTCRSMKPPRRKAYRICTKLLIKAPRRPTRRICACRSMKPVRKKACRICTKLPMNAQRGLTRRI